MLAPQRVGRFALRHPRRAAGSAHMRERTLVVWEVRRIEYLDPGVLLAVEWSHDRRGGRSLTAQAERLDRAVEPQAQVELVRGRERSRAPSRQRERLLIEDAPHRDRSAAMVARPQVALVPGHAERLVRLAFLLTPGTSARSLVKGGLWCGGWLGRRLS